MSYAFTRRGQLIVRTPLLNNNLTSLTVVKANAVNGIQKLLNKNLLTQLRSYY